MGYITDLLIVINDKNKGTKEYYDAKIRMFKRDQEKFLETLTEHLYRFSPLSSEEEEEDLITIKSLLNKYMR